MAHQEHRQDIKTEQAFFDRYIGEKHKQVGEAGYPLDAEWLQRARTPRPRPLDCWEYASICSGRFKESGYSTLAAAVGG